MPGHMVHGPSPTLVAFFLPQYHPIPENNAWWGPGFTEWTNVARARPLFHGHDQPHIPADLGFYDLRLAETREAQAALAARYGIGAFCYYHYWFNGRRILERPFSEVLASGRPGFPFCLCWANEDWTRAWDGGDHQVLLQQVYSAEDDVAHFEALLPAFADARYLRKDNRPVFLIYRAHRLPDPQATTRRWRELAQAHGLPGLFLLRVESFPEESGDPRKLGFDAAVDFQPEWRALVEPGWKQRRRRLFEKLGRPLPARWKHTVVPYTEVVRRALSQPTPNYPRYPGATPGWDNSARRSAGGLILRDSRPELYGDWLRQLILRDRPEFVFINAWNEWAEGCHLEPCQKWGHAYLQATDQALSATAGSTAERLAQVAEKFASTRPA